MEVNKNIFKFQDNWLTFLISANDGQLARHSGDNDILGVKKLFEQFILCLSGTSLGGCFNNLYKLPIVPLFGAADIFNIPVKKLYQAL